MAREFMHGYFEQMKVECGVQTRGNRKEEDDRERLELDRVLSLLRGNTEESQYRGLLAPEENYKRNKYCRDRSRELFERMPSKMVALKGFRAGSIRQI